MKCEKLGKDYFFPEKGDAPQGGPLDRLSAVGVKGSSFQKKKIKKGLMVEKKGEGENRRAKRKTA